MNLERIKIFAGTNVPMSVLVTLLLAATLLGPYLGLWFGLVLEQPIGGVTRDLLILLTLVYTAATLLYPSRRGFLAKALPLLCAWGAYALWVTILALTDPDPLKAVLVSRTHLAFPLVGLLVLIVTIEGKLNVPVLRRSIFVLGILAAVLGIADAATQSRVLEILGYVVTPGAYSLDFGGESVRAIGNSIAGTTRASGGLSNPIDYSYLMAIFILYATVTSGILGNDEHSEHGPLDRLLAISLVVLAQLAALLTVSRGALLLLALSAALFVGVALFIYRKLNIRLLIVAVVIVVLDLAVLASTEYGDILYGRVDPAGTTPTAVPEPSGSPSAILPEESLAENTPSERISAETSFSDQLRIQQFYAGIDALKDNPLGIGIGTQGTGGSTARQVVADIYFLWVPVEIGVPGLALLATVIIVNFLLALKYWGRQLGYGLLFSSFALTLLTAGTLSTAFVNPVVVIFYWTIFNLELGNIILRNRTGPKDETELSFRAAEPDLT